jgi:hypothetical protein
MMATQEKPASGELIVGLTEDCQNVVINHPDLLPDADGCGHIVFSPDQARNLAWLLFRKANIIEGTECAHCNRPITQETGWATAMLRYCFREECQQEFYKEAQAMIRKVDPETADRMAAATNRPEANARRQRELDAGEAISFTVNPEMLNVIAAKQTNAFTTVDTFNEQPVPDEAYVNAIRPSFQCPKCGAVSYNPNDVRERYCGACHKFAGE